ncbi:MAG: hypothetical protein AAF734_04685 [Bacteroidota bacterium]
MRTIGILLALLLGAALTQAQITVTAPPTINNYCGGPISLGDITITEDASKQFPTGNRTFILTLGAAYEITDAGTVSGVGLNTGSEATITGGGNLEVTYNVQNENDGAAPPNPLTNTIVLSGV